MKLLSPATLKVTPVRGCNLNCEFCGIRGVRKKKGDWDPLYLDCDMFEAMCREANDMYKNKIRVEFAGFGEPLMHPQLHKLCKIASTVLRNPSLILITNSVMLFKMKNEKQRIKYVKRLFDNGLNSLMVDCYFKDVEDGLYDFFHKVGAKVFHFFDDKPNVFLHFKKGYKQVVLTPDLATYKEKKRMSRPFHSMGGNVPEELRLKLGIPIIVEPVRKRCVKPFRDLTITPDGIITMCCMDWSFHGILGQYPKQSLKEIWHGKVINSFRTLLYNKQRIISPCLVCDFYGGVYQHFIKLEKEYSYETSIKNIMSLSKKWKKYRSKYRKISHCSPLLETTSIKDYL